jgi:hypothetical protein
VIEKISDTPVLPNSDSTSHSSIFEPIGSTTTYSMPSIILKKTFMTSPAGLPIDTSLSFHGAVSEKMITDINHIFATELFFHAGIHKPTLQMDKYGHYYASMTDDCQMHHEEDLLVATMDYLERMGYLLVVQYDAEFKMRKMVAGSSSTSRELFVFRKKP